ncbi:MAG: hypothetical protein JNN28_01430 [Saprospiraceae bacterium]|nr:hypothetical protein [Saprospiraceae bacterium]
MKKLLILCIIAGIYAYAPIHANNFPYSGYSISMDESINQMEAPEIMITVELKQTASLTLTGNWTSTSQGPFTVFLLNWTTGQVVQNFVTNDTQWVFTNLTRGHNYRLQVGDSHNFLADTEMVQY